MTIEELYRFAKSNSLLNESIGTIIDVYIKHISTHNSILVCKNNNSIKQDNIINTNKSNIDNKNKIEYSVEDVLDLFSD